ncbi:replication restart helicase PriA [Alloacidobacterium sp.]|uniref:replication restart helicase PriA n=1 Tax=Alloacidobacterium sp. TaxID=2951999 RepID=UPI002D4A6B94|nr:primosomal protein N' [Alloacidobacterium sp.]HYK36387.1 primosomal protein N' [Alloacidobacterium sp.]
MPAFCDVALPVPLDRAFTYALNGEVPGIGCRVLVPFRNEKLTGVVVRLHDNAPPVEAKALITVLDREPILSEALLELAQWIAQYYIAPLGEVLRTMLPLMAEVRRVVLYKITDTGRQMLHEGAEKGSSRRSKLSPADQNMEYAVLNYLESGEAMKVSRLRSSTGASLQLLHGMLRKRWIARETAADARDARRTVRFAVLVEGARLPKLNENQQAILAELAGAGGELPVAELCRLTLPQSTLATLVKRELVEIKERPADFHLTALGVKRPEYELNAQQVAAFDVITTAVASGEFRPHLLHGVTGSGKTAVYLSAMRHALDQGKSAILLVPEIGLTPAMAAQLHHAFGSEVALLHSALTPEERAEQWHRIRRGDARIVVGTRSAVFAPVANLGLIVVDEEHDSSYKQEEMPRYHARDVAVMRAKLSSAVVVLGSATPSLESWQNALRWRYTKIEMHERVNQRPLPLVELVDMRREFQETGQEQLFSRALVEETKAALDRDEQAIILLNRRGYSYVVLCRACGEKLECENCAISLTYHKAVGEDVRAQVGQRLECHYCGYKRTVPKLCTKCESEHLYFLGAGSQQGEERLQEIFPGARIGRMDRDTVRGRHDLERLLMRLHSGEINLLVGTQMIAKGHDIHGVTLVGVVGCDHALGLPDFRASERVFQLMTQVSGRAGRGELPGKVIVQTYHPDHYAIECAAKHDFHAFVDRELKYRRWMHYPPFNSLANVLIQSQHLEEAAGWAATLGRWFQQTQMTGVRVLGPATAPISKIKRIYRFHLVMKAEKRQLLAKTLQAMLAHAEESGIPRRNLIIDVDAVSLM